MTNDRQFTITGGNLFDGLVGGTAIYGLSAIFLVWWSFFFAGMSYVVDDFTHISRNGFLNVITAIGTLIVASIAISYPCMVWAIKAMSQIDDDDVQSVLDQMTEDERKAHRFVIKLFFLGSIGRILTNSIWFGVWNGNKIALFSGAGLMFAGAYMGMTLLATIGMLLFCGFWVYGAYVFVKPYLVEWQTFENGGVASMKQIRR